MKKLIKIAALSAVALTVLASCGTTSNAPSDSKSAYAQNINKNIPEILDWQGREVGIAIPQWVLEVASGDSQATLKALKLSGKQSFILANHGPNLEYVKDWTDHVAVETEASATFSRSVASAVQSAMNQRQDLSATERETKMTQYTASLTAMELNGLEKSAQFWTKTRSLKDGIEVATSPSDYEIIFRYYVVYTMDEKIFNTQLKAALDGVEDNASEGAKLKEMISEKLQGIIMPEDDE